MMRRRPCFISFGGAGAIGVAEVGHFYWAVVRFEIAAKTTVFRREAHFFQLSDQAAGHLDRYMSLGMLSGIKVSVPLMGHFEYTDVFSDYRHSVDWCWIAGELYPVQ